MIRGSELGAAGSLPALPFAQKKVIEGVVEWFGSLSGERLRELTHSESPWLGARKGCKVGDRCANEIAAEAIRRFYVSSACVNSIAR